jgi:DNA-binding transcriptional MerR regulator
MSAQKPITTADAVLHAEKLMNDGFSLSEIKSLLTKKAEQNANAIKTLREGIANLEQDTESLRETFRHILGIERNAAATNIDGLITNRKPVAEVPAAITQAELIENAAEIVTAPITADGRAAVVPNGTYTVVMANERRTIKISDHWDETEKARGTRVAKFLTGSDNERDYTGFAFISSTGKAIIWKKFRNGSALLQSALAYLLQGDNYAEAGMTYAIESGNCWKCGRKLTVPASVSRGVGPECAKKLGY